MTTLLHKTNAHEKARALSSGFLELIKALTPTPRQGLASKRTSFRSVMKHHTNDIRTSVSNLASIQMQKYTSIWFLTCSQAGGM